MLQLQAERFSSVLATPWKMYCYTTLAIKLCDCCADIFLLWNPVEIWLSVGAGCLFCPFFADVKYPLLLITVKLSQPLLEIEFFCNKGENGNNTDCGHK